MSFATSPRASKRSRSTWCSTRSGDSGRINVRILWVGPSESPPALEALHQSLRRQVGKIGLHVGKGVYRPHVTLVRKADLRKKLPEDLEPDIQWTARRLALVASELLPSGSRYRILAEKELL